MTTHPYHAIKAVETATGITIEAMRHRTRKRAVVDARRVLASVLNRGLGWGLAETAAAMNLFNTDGRPDHTTVLHYLKALDDISATDPGLRVWHENAMRLAESMANDPDPIRIPMWLENLISAKTGENMSENRFFLVFISGSRQGQPVFSNFVTTTSGKKFVNEREVCKWAVKERGLDSAGIYNVIEITGKDAEEWAR